MKILRILLLMVLFMCQMGYVWAQTSDTVLLSFRLEDAKSRNVLGSVTCRVYTNTGKFYKYAISDEQGNLGIDMERSDTLEFMFLGYKNIKAPASKYDINKRNLLLLQPDAVMLKEVQVKAPPIRSKGDTLVYHVGAFLNAGDKHLEDILKKLPGIRVADDGTVSYQGKAINKFYIEGQNLLGDSYTQATRNMPVDAVADVEVLENHQPVNMLRNKQYSDQAALNIKLDKGHFSRPFGEVKVGLGFPSIWNNQLFLTQLMGKNQLLLTGKMNNVGIDLTSEIQEHIDVSDMDSYEPWLAAVLSTGMMNIDIPKEWYLKNKSYSLGINNLMSLSKDATFRTNVLFYEDHSSMENNYNSLYGGEQLVSVNEDYLQGRNQLSIVPILTYELNGAEMFVSNELKYSFSNTKLAKMVDMNGNMIKECIHNRPSFVQNYFTSSFSIGKLIAQVKSFLRYTHDSESLEMTADSVNSYRGFWQYALESFVTKNKMTTSIELGKNNLDLGLQVYYRNNRYAQSDYMSRHNLQVTFSPSYIIKYGRDNNLSIEVPIGWNHVGLSMGRNSLENNNYFSFSPVWRLKQELSRKLCLRLSATVGTYDILGGFYASSPIRLGYRTEYHSNNVLLKNVSSRFMFRLNYKNLATMFFANFTASYTNEKRNGYSQYEYNDSLNIVTDVKGKNHVERLLLNISADKSFSDAGISVKSGFSYHLNSYLLVQSGMQTKNHSNIFSADVAVVFQKNKWLRVNFEGKGNLFWEKNDRYHSSPLKMLETNSMVWFFPIKGIGMKVNYLFNVNEISKAHYASCGLLNTSLQYSMGKNCELSLSFSNILNTKRYIITEKTGFNVVSTYVPLREREVLTSILLRI